MCQFLVNQVPREGCYPGPVLRAALLLAQPSAPANSTLHVQGCGRTVDDFPVSPLRDLNR